MIGDFKYAFHRGVLSEPIGTIPAILFSEFQLVFEAMVCAIAVGGACEKGRTLPLIPFIFVYSLSSLRDHGLMFDTALENIHLLEAVIGMTWSFVGSCGILALIDCGPELEVLATDE